MTMPGTFISDSPNVASPSTNTASTTPKIVPTPPEIATPPRITTVMMSSSQPSADIGPDDPMRAVSSAAARPGQQTGQDEKREAQPVDPDAGKPRCDRIGPDREQPAPGRGLVQEDAEADRQHEEDQERQWHRRHLDEIALAEREVISREIR